MDGLTVLVEAKKEYMAQMCSIMIPHMIETFENMYKEAYKFSKGKEVLKQFQRFLQGVKDWNNSMISQHVEKLTGTCGWFNDLMAAVFVSYVKILSSVRLNAENKKINIKLPTNDVFVARCYECAAGDLYKNPLIYHQEMTEYERDDALAKRFVACIEATVQKLIPVQEILKTYISRTEDNLEFGKDYEDTEDPVVDEPTEPEPEYGIPEPEVPGVPEVPEVAPEIPEVAPEVAPEVPGVPGPAHVGPPAEEPVKHISMNSVPDNVLFPDASD